MFRLEPIEATGPDFGAIVGQPVADRERPRYAQVLVGRVECHPAMECVPAVGHTERRLGPERSLVCGPYASLPDSDMTVAEKLSTVHAR